MAWRAASWPGRALQWMLRIGLVALAVALVAASALAWRLSQGPMEIGWLARRLAAAALPADGPARLAIGDATLAWHGFRGGDGGLELRLHDVGLVEPTGTKVARIDQADVTLSLPRLLEFRLSPRRIALDGVELRAVRAEDGALTLNLPGLGGEDPAVDSGPGADLAGVLQELRRPASSDRARPAPGLDALSQLRQVRVREVSVSLLDAASGATVRGKLASMDLERQAGGGVNGSASGTLELGAATASLQATAGLLADGGTHVEARLAPLQTSAVAGANAALAPLGMLDAAFEGTASLDLLPSLRPRAGALHAATGAAAISLKGGTARFERLALDAEASWSGEAWRPDRVELKRAQAVLASPRGGWPTTLEAKGEMTRSQGVINGAFDLSLDHAAFADLPALWPAAWGGHVRPWLTENVTSGTARDGAFTVKLVAPEAKLADVEVVDGGGTMLGEDVTIHWLRPVPPIEHAQAVLTVVNADVLDIAVPSASQGGMTLKDGLMHFTGLAGKDQFLALTASVQAAVPELLQLLRHPRLKLLDRHPIPIKSSAGTMAGRLAVDLPMKDHLAFEQVAIHAQGHLDHLKLGGIVAGRDLERGDVQFDVSQEGLHASGRAEVAAIPSAVTVEMDFRQGPPTQVTQRATLVGRAAAGQLAAAGLDAGSVITGGALGLDVSYTAQRDGAGQVAAKVDLSQAGVAALGWRKPPGPAASASATVELEHDKLAGISAIEAHGPGMAIVARARASDGRPSLLEIDRITLGPTQASGEVHFPSRPGDPIRARLSGPVLDLSTQFAGSGGRGGGPAGSTPFIADARFEQVVLGHGRSIHGVSAHAEHDGKRLRVLQASSTGPEQLRAAIEPQGTGRRLSVRAADAGAVLRLLGVVDTVHGGSLALEGRFDDRYAEPPLSGTLDVSEFGVRDAVILGKLLQAITIYGIFDAIRGEGVQFSRLIMPFTLNQSVLQIGETRAFSSSLGLTVQGWVDLGRNTLDLRGTIVPAYAVNAALGTLPLVGRLFSPEKGGGLVAVSYGVSGKSSDPSVRVNPLSALTPGFMRRLFSIFG